MKNTDKPKLIIHIDVDSPSKLLDFYQIKGVKFDQKDLESFYAISFNRIFDFLKTNNLKATFFIVGNDLESSNIIQKVVLKAHSLGHEIENHSYSHPFGLANLSDDEIEKEINKCSEIIYQVTGRKPIGFRSPGYSIDNRIINILRKNGFMYDSSGFWSVMNPILAYGNKLMYKNGLKNDGFGYVTSKIPHEPYCPDSGDWMKKAELENSFFEIPLPRTKFFGLPFYNNINLWSPELYSYLISNSIKRKQMVYLFHAIEFMDLTDKLPVELNIHPNLKTPLSVKLDRSNKIIKTLLKRYDSVTTGQFINSRSGKSL